MAPMYQERLIEHYRNPRNQGSLDHPSFYSYAYNGLCGDRVEVFGIVEELRLVKVAFRGQGCVISQATASVVCEVIQGKPVLEIMHMNTDDIVKLIGIDLGPVRLKCALMIREALQRGIAQMNQ